MLRSDARTRSQENDIFDNINSINIDVIMEVQKEIEPYDMISLVFLLYEVPHTALQRLLVYQRVSKDVDSGNINLLYDWALNAQSRPTWKYEFLEALTICRLYNIVRKLGFNVSAVKKHYLPDNVYVNIYIDPMKKGLYKLCEGITSENLTKLKRTLVSYNVNVSEHETCEVVLLELLCQKFIKFGKFDHITKAYISSYETDNLIKIIKNISGLNEFANILKDIENQVNISHRNEPHTSSNGQVKKIELCSNDSKNEDFDEIYQLLNQLHVEETNIPDWKTDTVPLLRDAYPIKNKERIGVCCIINQEVFYPSKESIQGKERVELKNRLGSTQDLEALERTMSSLKFDIKSKSNLDHKEVFRFLRDIIQNHVHSEDSIFVLCILSHGIRGHIYAADSVKIKVEDIQKMLDSDEFVHLHGIPKIMILQACQVDNEVPLGKPNLVADGPSSNRHLRKSHFLIYWATAPEYEAYRDEKKGSIFIQFLCASIKKRAKHEQLTDIFTKVTDMVAEVCSMWQRDQLPICETTLRKKLYLYVPDK